MKKQTKKNSSPAWELTEIAVKKGEELSKKYKVDRNLVIISLYLAHTRFNINKNSPIRINHPELSSKFTKPYLDKWKVPIDKQEIIFNSIEAHHGKIKPKTLIAEVVKNAECYKFVTIKGALIFLHELGRRDKLGYKESIKEVLEKVDSKYKLLTFPECKEEAKKNVKIIKTIFKK